jgi:hypothetical protein
MNWKRIFNRPLLFTAIFIILFNLTVLVSVSHVHSDLRSRPDCIFCKFEYSIFSLTLVLLVLAFALIRLLQSWNANHFLGQKIMLRGGLCTRAPPFS